MDMEQATKPHPMRVAIVEDEPIACREIERGLGRRADYEIESFADGHAFVQRMKAIHFDLLLCDLKLPGMGRPDISSARLRPTTKDERNSTGYCVLSYKTVQSYHY
jgi:CheY-like chemotaxis protein